MSPEGRGRSLRPRLRRLPPTGPPVPRHLRGWPVAPLFAPRPRGRPAIALPPPPGQPERPAVADCRVVSLTPGQRARTRFAGLFLFLPLLCRLRFDQLV